MVTQIVFYIELTLTLMILLMVLIMQA